MVTRAGLKPLLAALSCLAFMSGFADSATARDHTELVATSPDLDRVLFETRAALLPRDDDGGCEDLYLREADSLRLVNEAKDGPKGACHKLGHPFTDGEIGVIAFDTRARLDPGDQNDLRDVYIWREGAVEVLTPGGTGPDRVTELSHDGSSIFIASRDPLVGEDADGKGDLYRWRDGAFDLITVGTASRRSGKTYPNATADGSTVFFGSLENLTEDDRDESCADRGYACHDIYRWRDGQLELVTTGQSGTRGSYATLSSYTATGDVAYFATEEGMTQDDVNGVSDLYEWSSGAVTRITPDNPNGTNSEYRIRQTADGQGGMVVTTDAPLLPSDTDDKTDVYTYADGVYEQMPADRGGSASDDVSVVFVSAGLERVIVETDEQLVVRDRNDYLDIYVWEPATNRVGLVSSGTDDGYSPAYADGWSTSGQLVVFDSRRSFLPGDNDGDGLDVFVGDSDTGEIESLSADLRLPEGGDVFTEAVRRDAEAVIAFSYEPLSDDDTDGLEGDLYQLGANRQPKLLSAAP